MNSSIRLTRLIAKAALTLITLLLPCTPASAQTTRHIFHSTPIHHSSLTPHPSPSASPAPAANISTSITPVTVGASTSAYPATTSVPIVFGAIINLRITIAITHPNISELQIALRAPDGKIVELMQSHGLGGGLTLAASNDTFVFDARSTLPGDGAFGGYKRPKTTGANSNLPAPAPAGP